MSRLALVTTIWSPLIGGMSRVAEEEAWALAKLQPLTVFTLAPLAEKTGEEILVPNLTVRRLFAWPQVGFAGVTPQLIWQLRHFDTVYVQAPAYGMMWPVVLWKWIFGGRLVATLHMNPVGKNWRRVWFRLAQWEMRLFLRVADQVRVSSATGAQNKLLKKPPQIIPFGLRRDYFARGEKIWPALFTFLFVGGLDQQHYFKGLPVLLAALAELLARGQKARLWIVGDGSEREIFENMARRLGLQTRVTFWGRVSDERLREIYTTASALILPSTDSSETFGLVLLEGMAAGLPVIASDLPGVNEVVTDNSGFLVAAGEEIVLAKAMERLLLYPELATQLSVGARARAAELGDLATVVEKLTNLLY